MEDLVWLSYPLDENSPAYGGGKALTRKNLKCIDTGDNCNQVELTFSNHLGSHVDAPKHFIDTGKTLDRYSPSEWVFNKPLVLDIHISPNEMITPEHINDLLEKYKSRDPDLLLLRTGFFAKRQEDIYWNENPGISNDVALYLESRFPALKSIGMDTISLSSFQNREMGKISHHEFLSRGFRIFEDLALGNIPKNKTLQKVLALPLQFSNADGAPCTIIGWLHRV